jgi:hypothetical protein
MRVPAERTFTSDPDELAMLDVVRQAVSVLPPSQRDAVLMHYIDGLSCEEIAALLGSTPGAIRVRLHRARQQLRERLASYAPPTKLEEEYRMIEMRLEDVILRVAADDPMNVVSDRRIVVLKEADGDRLLPIWIARAEGDSLALKVTGETTPRPVTSDLMAELLRVAGAKVERVSVTSLRDNTFYATIAVATGGQADEVDARPSDALNLAVRVGAPIFADDALLAQAALPADDLNSRLDQEAANVGFELPPGRWRSISAELLQSLYD